MRYCPGCAVAWRVPTAAWRRASVLVFAGALALSGCTSSKDSGPLIVQPGAPGETSTVLSEDEVPEIELAEYTEADVEFLAAMIEHHGQAVRMTALVGERTEREDLPLFAQRIELSQEDEIALMERWLAARDQEEAEHGGHLMPGMLTEEQFAELEAASGPEFDRLFLEFMVYHHEGAITMVQDLLAGGGGEEPELYQLILHIQSDQRIELNRMNRLLAELDEAS